MPHNPDYFRRGEPRSEMDRSFNATALVPHRLLPFGANGVRVELAADRVVEQEAGIAKGLKRRLPNEPMLVETTKKGAANYYMVRCITLGRLIEVLRCLVTRILAHDEISKNAWEPGTLDVVFFPLVPLCTATCHHLLSRHLLRLIVGLHPRLHELGGISLCT